MCRNALFSRGFPTRPKTLAMWLAGLSQAGRCAERHTATQPPAARPATSAQRERTQRHICGRSPRRHARNVCGQRVQPWTLGRGAGATKVTAPSVGLSSTAPRSEDGPCRQSDTAAPAACTSAKRQTEPRCDATGTASTRHRRTSAAWCRPWTDRHPGAISRHLPSVWCARRMLQDPRMRCTLTPTIGDARARAQLRARPRLSNARSPELPPRRSTAPRPTPHGPKRDAHAMLAPEVPCAVEGSGA